MDRLLTPGSLKKLLDEVPLSSTFQPVLQVIALKEISKGTNLRYRVYVHDGVHSSSNAMLAVHHTQMVQSGAISAHCLIKVTDYTLSVPTTSKKVLCIAGLTVIKSGEEVGGKLGDPTPLKYTEQNSNDVSSVNSATSSSVTALKETNTGFYGSKPQTQSAPQASKSKPSVAGGTPGTPGGGPARIYPIASLTPYQNRWTIKGRVTQKSGIRTYNNSRGEGKFFNCIFSDESGEIKATAWKSECDLFFDMVELNKVYNVSKAQLKIANKQFSNTNNDYEMNLSAETKIVACDDGESASVPTMQFKFVNVADLINKAVGSIIDVCGIVYTVADLSTIIAKASQREMTKRDVEIVDDTGMLVRLTVWGDEAKSFPTDLGVVLAVKACKVGEWNGRSLGCVSSTQIIQNPDCADAHRLRGWYDTIGSNTQFKSYASDGSSGGASGQPRVWRTFDSVQTDKVGLGDKPDYYQVKAFAAFIKKENCLYQACASEGCNKKVFDNGDGTYRCEKCNKSSSEFKHRLLLQTHLADNTGYHWATAFQDCAEKFLGKTALEMGEIRENEDLFDYTIKSALFKPYQITLRSKMESYNDDNRLKTVMLETKELDVPAYNRRLLSEVRKMLSK